MGLVIGRSGWGLVEIRMGEDGCSEGETPKPKAVVAPAAVAKTKKLRAEAPTKPKPKPSSAVLAPPSASVAVKVVLSGWRIF